MIKNEADILELFIRHTLQFATEMVFIDNGCMDASMDIINRIRAEGKRIVVHNEAHVYYEQFRLENKYILEYSNKDYDLIIPLDVDEFLACDTDLLNELDNINDEKVTLIKWRTYCLGDAFENKMLFERCSFLRKNEKNSFTKIIIPSKIYKKEKMLVSMGHHDVIENDEFKEANNKLYIAHFPVRSEEQIKLKIIQGTISQLMSSYGRVVAFHWKELYDSMNKGAFNVVKYSKEYALTKEDKKNVQYVYAPFIKCNNEAYTIKYPELQKNDLINILFFMNQISCVKKIVDSIANKDKKHVLVYGTGNTTQNTLLKIKMDPYEIIAFVDSDEEKWLTHLDDKLIISPDMIKYLDFEAIIVSSIYRKEIEEVLVQRNISMNKIIYYKDFLLELLTKTSHT